MEITVEQLEAIMRDCYKDGFSRCSYGLDMDYEYSRTRLLIERGTYLHNGEKVVTQ